MLKSEIDDVTNACETWSFHGGEDSESRSCGLWRRVVLEDLAASISKRPYDTR